ncbi:hypothetical protein BC936DRAFT_148592 [Jimgerdemannia flammicorona]|uniref:Uncharacterized protein n=1 Tax=Jimgerdemannia flammicorona TaxID=994334 RepID=A0A433D2Q4_9FUNG|nr:hypothetical protein BC936DRAFT_148592 [Jimgerdemannia flammicorona]
MEKIRSLRCRVTIKDKTQDMMESLAEETATESRAIPVKRKQSEDFGEPGGIEEQEAYPMGSKEGEIKETLYFFTDFTAITTIPNDQDESDMVTGIGIVPRDCPVIINDVEGLQLGPPPRQESRWLINKIDVSAKWHQFKEKSLKSVTERGLFVKSHI